MKLFKRFAAAILAGAMALAMLTACGGVAGGGSTSNATERAVIDAINKGTANANYTNDSELQGKVRKYLSKVDETGMIKVTDLPYIEIEGEDGKYHKEYGVSDYEYNKQTNVVSMVSYILGNGSGESTTEIKALEVTEEALKKLESGEGLDLNKAVGSTGQDVTEAIKSIGVATYTAKNGKTYIGLALKISERVDD